MLYEELDDRFGRRKKRTVIFGMAGGTPPTPPTPPTPSVLEEKDLNFYDFEGTLVASYGADEIAGLTELPEAPDHSADEVPLTFEEWNWTLEEIKEYHTDMPENKIDVGATYHPTDGKLHLIVETFVDNYLDPLEMSFQSGAQIDWGDGTSSSVSGSSIASHRYENKGQHHVAVTLSEYSTYFTVYRENALTPKEAYVPRIITNLQGAFSYCPILKKVAIPSSVTILGSAGKPTFRECYSLEAIILPRSLTVVGAQTLYKCKSLRVLSLPPTITSIEDGAIGQSSSLKKLTMPRGLLSLGSTAFEQTGLKEIRLPSSLTSIGQQCFSSAFALRKINIPAGIRQLPNYALRTCSALEQVELNEGLESLGTYVLENVKALQTLIIPSTVTSIGDSAFSTYYCLPSITVLATTPPTLGSTSVFFVTTIQKIYVPAESVEAYKSATNWSNYAEKIEAIPA